MDEQSGESETEELVPEWWVMHDGMQFDPMMQGQGHRVLDRVNQLGLRICLWDTFSTHVVAIYYYWMNCRCV